MNRYASKPLRNSYGAGCLELRAGVFWLVFLLTTYFPGVSNGLLHAGELPPQYAFEEILIDAATAEEPFATQYSSEAALDYLEAGARAWSQDKQCISCHTNGSYALVRPMLSSSLGSSPEWLRAFLMEELEAYEAKQPEGLRKDIVPTQLAYLAAGLASWDRFHHQTISAETDRALRLMFKAQSEDGSFLNEDCWPPLESSHYQSAAVAALAVALAPAWSKDLMPGDPVTAKLDRLIQFLKNTPAPHDYARVWLLWVDAWMPEWGLVETNQDWVQLLWDLQNSDGGWSMRSFADPEKWGDGSRADRLRSETTRQRQASDGHMTGLVCMVLKHCAVSDNHPSLRRGLSWLETHQRESGRWWARSLNTDRYHFITYSATAFGLAALSETPRNKRVQFSEP